MEGRTRGGWRELAGEKLSRTKESAQPRAPKEGAMSLAAPPWCPIRSLDPRTSVSTMAKRAKKKATKKKATKKKAAKKKARKKAGKKKATRKKAAKKKATRKKASKKKAARRKR